MSNDDDDKWTTVAVRESTKRSLKKYKSDDITWSAFLTRLAATEEAVSITEGGRR